MANQEYRRRAEAADAMVRLYTFASLVSILEGGSLPGCDLSAERTARKIISLCQREQKRQLDKWDRLSGRDKPTGGEAQG